MTESWKYSKIGDIMVVERGGSPRPIKKYITNSEDGLNWVKISDATASDKYIYKTKQKITKDGLHKTRLVEIGDFILSNSMSFGRPYIMKTQGCIHDGWLVLKQKQKDFLDQDFLYHLLGSPYIFNEFNRLAAGSTVRNLNIRLVSSVQIPIPPLSEQKEIVAILDKAFAAIDQAKANIERNIQNAKELFQSKLNEIFSHPSTGSGGDGWEEKSLGEVCYVLNGFAFKSKDTVERSNVQLLRMGNLYKNVLDLTRKPVFYPEFFAKEHLDFIIKEGDLIMSLTGTIDKTDYGYTVKVPKVDVKLLLNQRIMKIEVHDSNILNKDYLKNYLLSPDFLSRLYETASGTRQANLSSRTILNLKINYPVKTEQQLQIVQQFNQLKNLSNHIENTYLNKLLNIEELKKSILQKAFAGELTQQIAV